MTLLAIALKYLRGRVLASVLTAVSVALGVGLVIASMLVGQGIGEGFVASATDYNLVVGAKGSPMQLVLGGRVPHRRRDAEYRIHDLRGPNGGSARRGGGAGAWSATRIRASATWRRTMRISPLAVAAQASALATGRLFSDDAPDAPAYEAVLGAEAARRTGLRIGDRFYEGEEMAELSAHRGRRPPADPHRRRSRNLHIARELLGDERDCA